MGFEQVEDIAHVAGMGVLKGEDAAGDFARVHGLEDLLKRGIGDGAAPREEVLLRHVGMGTLGAKIAHRAAADARGLIGLGEVHELL